MLTPVLSVIYTCSLDVLSVLTPALTRFRRDARQQARFSTRSSWRHQPYWRSGRPGDYAAPSFRDAEPAALKSIKRKRQAQARVS